MKIRSVAWTTFRIPFRRPFAAAGGTLSLREGLLLRLTTSEGLSGLGEASPLTTLHGGTLADTVALIEHLAPRLIGRDPRESELLLRETDLRAPGGAAAACALDTASCDLLAQEAGISVAMLLGGAQAEAVPVNATIGVAAAHDAAAAAVSAVSAGFTCIKLKAGMAPSCGEEVERVRRVREAIGPAVRLRLDANGAWDVATARAILHDAARYDLEMVEQPVAPADLGGMARLRRTVPMPIAADEAVGTVEDAHRVIAAGAADILVVKPMTAGGPRPGRAILEMARAAGLEAIVTTTLDAGVGVAMALHLAATSEAALKAPPLRAGALRAPQDSVLHSPWESPTSEATSQSCAPKGGSPEGTPPVPPLAACGLATGPLLESDLLGVPLPVQNGVMRTPPGPGLGVTLDEAALARYASACGRSPAKTAIWRLWRA
jgi:o-succinylbenzoate synthase